MYAPLSRKIDVLIQSSGLRSQFAPQTTGGVHHHGFGPTTLGRVIAAAVLALVAGTTAADEISKGDWKAGADVYFRCTGCHALAENRVGPRHCGLLGRRAGSVKGFGYSDAMEHSGIVWSEKTLDRFLEDPMKTVPGTLMVYTGVTDRKERADLIAFLRKASASTACKKK